ncbi:hypothetical protein MASR2M117_04560 [Paludibacter sp.]
MKLKQLFFAIAALSLLFSCEKEVAVTGISIDPTSITLNEVGQKDTLKAVLAPEGAKGEVIWESSNTAVATVEGNGLTAVVTAVGKGTAKITATVDIFAAECNVIVSAQAETGAGSKTDPYSVDYVIGKSTGNKDVIDQAGVWVKGIVVGRYNSTSKAIETADPDGVNIVIAVTAGVTDVKNAVCVQVPVGDIRNGLAIMNQPNIIGKEILVHGDITTYNTMPGVKNTDGYWLVQEDTGINPPEKGNFDVPVMSISELGALYTAPEVNLTGEKKVVGVVTSDLAGGNSTSKKNLIITSENNTSGIAIRFTDKDNTYALGDKIEVLLTGKLTMYENALQLQVAQINTAKIGTATITPRTTTIAEIDANVASYEYCVVKVSGVLAGPTGITVYGNSNTHQNNTLTDGGKSLVAFVAKYSAFIDETIPTETVSVTGIIQKFRETKQIIIRNISDVKKL